jgi:hypothetical protein
MLEQVIPVGMRFAAPPGLPNWRQILKPLLHSLETGSEPAPVDHVSILVDRAVMGPDISQVNADGYFGGECPLGTSAMRCCAVFFMGNSFSDLEDLLIPFLDATIQELVCTPRDKGGGPLRSFPCASVRLSLAKTLSAWNWVRV